MLYWMSGFLLEGEWMYKENREAWSPLSEGHRTYDFRVPVSWTSFQSRCHY